MVLYVLLPSLTSNVYFEPKFDEFVITGGDFTRLEPSPTWLLNVMGRQERAWGPVKIDHYSLPLLGRKVTNNAARKF